MIGVPTPLCPTVARDLATLSRGRFLAYGRAGVARGRTATVGRWERTRKAEARQKKAVGLDSMAEKNIETDESHHYRDTISHDLTYSALTQLPIM